MVLVRLLDVRLQFRPQRRLSELVACHRRDEVTPACAGAAVAAARGVEQALALGGRVVALGDLAAKGKAASKLGQKDVRSGAAVRKREGRALARTA